MKREEIRQMISSAISEIQGQPTRREEVIDALAEQIESGNPRRTKDDRQPAEANQGTDLTRTSAAHTPATNAAIAANAAQQARTPQMAPQPPTPPAPAIRIDADERRGMHKTGDEPKGASKDGGAKTGDSNKTDADAGADKDRGRQGQAGAHRNR